MFIILKHTFLILFYLLTLVVLNRLFQFLIHLQLELLTQLFPALNGEKYVYL